MTTESGRPFGKPIAVRAPPIRSYGRAQVLDDSQIRYEIHLEHAVSFRLSARRAPPRIVVNIAR